MMEKAFPNSHLVRCLLLMLTFRLAAQALNTNAPAILGASGNDYRAQVSFSLPVELTSATNSGNYYLSNLYGTVAVLTAAPGTNSQTVELTTARQLPFMAHWLTITAVADALTGTNLIAPNSQTVYTNVAFTTGYIKSEFYLGISGTTLAALTNSTYFPNSPNRVTYPTESFWFDQRIGANYGNRMSGILVPPVSGLYSFVVFSPGVGLLSLSTNENRAFAAPIASCQNQNITVSKPIGLEAGRHYYLESLTKEGTNPSDYAYLAWMTPGDTNGSLIPTTYLGNYLTDPAATITIAHQPADAKVYDNRHATFALDASGRSGITTNLTYQWQLNGQDIPGATDATYTTPLVYDTNSGSSYRVLAYLPGASLFSRSALLTVTQDLVPPTIVRTLNFGATDVQILFSEEVEPASATNLMNYTFAEGLPIKTASIDFLNTTVTLATAPMSYGSNYSLIVNGVRDQAMVPNTIASNTTVIVSVNPSTSQDIGAPPLSSVTTGLRDGVDIAACGKDVGGTSDQFNFNYQPCAGDFDISVRLAGLSLSDLWAKAGLMARETLGAGSRFAAILATPSMNGVSFEYRDVTNAKANSAGSFPVNYPDTWLRLQRFGQYITGYASYDGHTWSILSGAYYTNLPSILYVGLAVSSHNTTQRTLAQFRDWTLVGPDALVGTLANPHEPPGPSSRKTPIAISEIMYKPAPRTDGNNTEFLELYNSNPWFHDIGGYRITGNAMSYTVPAGTIIPGGGYLVIAASPQSMQNVYGITNLLGPYSGSLQKIDTISLIDEHGAVILTIPYSNIDPWPVAADGTGHSIVLAKPSYGEEDRRAWDISDVSGGSPGAAEAFRPDPLRDVRINELLAHSEDPTLEDFIELYNHSTYTNDLSGCILTDNPSIRKFVLPGGTLIAPGGFISFSRSHFGFGLSAEGETVYLMSPDGSHILDAVQFEAQADGVSLGRWPDGADALYPLASRTPGAANSSILIRDIVINELMYDPISGADDDQYIELYNQGTNLVSLAGWQFTAGITFTFPMNTFLAPGSYLVIAHNRTNLFAKYPNLSTANTVGDFTGKLSHNGEHVALAMPQTLNGINTIYVVEDEVTYGAGGRWGQWSAGGGSSLELLDPRSNHRLAANWADSDDTQKSTWTNIEATGVLDNGHNFGTSIGNAQIGPLDVGECLIDNVEVHAGAGANLVKNSGFETGLINWSLQGCMSRSSLENSGYGGSGHSLHIRCSSRIWTGANSCQMELNPNTLGGGQTATLRFKAKWLHGWPEILTRLNGNWFEAVGALPVPPNLGTPGARNSRSLQTPGPAIYEVTHSPALPTYGQDALITARAHDPDAVKSLALHYRLDPDMSYISVPMKDDGTGGDEIAGDGLFSARIPGTYGIVPFYVSATNARDGVSRFPALLNDNAPVRECIVMFGDNDSGGSFSGYHVWLTQTNLDRWSNLPNLSNEMVDGTFVNANRIIYNMQARYAGSPYHQQFYSPLYSPCHFKWVFPEDDKFLGATSFNKIHAPGNGPGDDASLQREQTAYTFMRALGVPWLNRRYVAVYVNGNRNLPLMEDTQCPDADMLKEYFPNDSAGFLYKMQPWFEFAPLPTSYYLDFNNISWCTIMNYTTTGRAKKAARYRYTFETRHTPDSANNLTNVFSLVDAASASGGPNYVSCLENLVDMENWMRVFAANHAAGNWDSFGTQNAQNLYGYIGTQGTRYSLLMFDFNIVLGNSGSWGPGQNLFTVTSTDNNLLRIYLNPVFRRMYFRALEELVKGPLDVVHTGPLIDAKYNAFVANGLSVENTASIKNWLTSARNSISSQIASATGATFLVNPSVQVNNDVAVITGTAPVRIKSITFNGVEWPIIWTSPTAWTATVPLKSGTNAFSVVGLDMHGQPVAGASTIVSTVFEGTPASPQGQVVINEIMYLPPGPNAQYLEIYNASTNLSFDLSGWQIPAVAYTFPPGSLITPNQYLVLAQNRPAFSAAYGATIPVFDTFHTPLSTGAQALALIRPNGGGSSEIVSQVRYESAAPWPSGANGQGSSLQLIDVTADNWRVGNWSGTSTPLSLSPGAPNPVRTNLVAFPPLWLNELQADNLTGITNRAGQHTPWLEIYTPSTTPVSLEALYLSDDYANLAKWSFPPGTILAAQGFKIVFADGQTNASRPDEFHASFSLASGSGNLALSRLDPNGVPQVLDYLNYTNLGPDHAYGSFPDGQVFARHELVTATPGASNSNAGTTLSVVINEWMAGNTLTVRDPVTGKYDDWFELYNYGDALADLAGCYLSHSLTNQFEFHVPSGYIIPAHGFLLVWADKAATNGTPDLHVNFKLSKSGSSICLRAADGTLVDSVSFGTQTSDISMGRYPDGGPNVSLLPLPTPGNTNSTPNTAPKLLPTGDKFVYLGQTLSFVARAEDNDFPWQSLTYSLDPGSPANASIDAATGTFTWTPSALQTPSTNFFMLRATDNGVPRLSSTEAFAAIAAFPPALVPTAVGVNQFTLAWPTYSGQIYQIQYADDLSSDSWIDLGLPFQGNGDIVSLTATNEVSSSSQRFFRLKIGR